MKEKFLIYDNGSYRKPTAWENILGWTLCLMVLPPVIPLIIALLLR